ncbi:MAG: phytanoyl-CoA dioxygenase family protein [Myxococcota bacterium]
MLTTEQIAEFEERGFVRIPGAFPREEAEALEGRVWRWLEKKRGISAEAADTWPEGQIWGLQELKSLGTNVIGTDATRGAIDGLLGSGHWKQPRDWGGLLITFPSAGTWRVPHRVWHTDFDYVGSLERPVGALVFSFVSDVPPGAGGTAVVEGSPHLVARFLAAHPRASFKKMRNLRRALLASEPWLVGLSSGDEDPRRNDRLMQDGAVIDGHPVRVAELSAEAGDLVIGHPWLLHAGAPNCGSRPRMMCVQRIPIAKPS